MNARSLALPVLASLALSACGGGGKGGQQGPPPLAVDTARAQRHDIATQIVLDGQIAPLQQSTLSSPQSGTVAVVNVNEGDRVSRGEMLASLDTAQLRAQLSAAQAAAAQAQARLNGSDVAAPISSQQYNSAYAQAQENYKAAVNRIATDEAALRNAEMVHSSNQQLLKQGYVAQTAAEQSRANYVAAQQELNNARQALPAAEAALRAAQSNLGQTQVDKATIASNQAAVAQAQSDVKLLETQIAQAAVYAPFDGIVTQRLLDPGAFAGPNQAIVQVSEIDWVYVNANVPDEDLPYVAAGTPVTFTSASLPGKSFGSKISDVNSVPTQGTLSYRARIRQPNPGNVLRGGMLVSVTVRKESHPNALVVPRTAIFDSDSGSSVYTVVDGKAKLLPVKVGLQTDTLAEVSGAGVEPGTVVITTRPDALQDGSVVAVAGAQGPGGPAGDKKPH